MNVVMTGAGGFVEVQGTAEGEPFSRAAVRGDDRARRDAASRTWSPARSRRWVCWRRERRTTRRRCRTGPRVEQPRQAARVPPPARAARHRRRRAGASSASPKPTSRIPRSSRTRSPRRGTRARTRPAGARRRFGPVRRRRWAARPACSARAMPAGRRPTRATTRSWSRRCAASPTGAPITTACSCSCVTRDDPEPLIAEGAWHGRSSTRRAAAAASATTRISRTSSGPDRRRAAARAQERALASRQGDARADRKLPPKRSRGGTST